MEGDSGIEMLNPNTKAKYQKDGSENIISVSFSKKKERKESKVYPLFLTKF